ncbi:hypothetical protein D3C76_1585330 [compost metagenome]
MGMTIEDHPCFLLFADHRISKGAKLLNLHRHHITSLQVNLILWRVAHHDSFRCSGQNNVTRRKCHTLRNITNNLLAVKNHIRSVRALTQFPIHRALNIELIGITHLIRRYKIGSNR